MKYTHYEITSPLYIKWFFDGKDGLSVGVNFDLVCNICDANYVICDHTTGRKYGEVVCTPKRENLTFEHTAMVKKPRIPGCGIKKLFLPIDKMKLEHVRKYGKKKVYRLDDKGKIMTEGILMKTGRW